MILQSDSARTKSVARRVNVASTTLTVAIVLQLAVHIITPLPLVQQIQPSDDSSTVSFKYAPDLTFFGQGTAPRPSQPLGRTCGTSAFTDCTPSNELFDKLSSGSVGTTVAGPKDIQFRNMFFYQNQSSSNEQLVVGLTLPMQNLLLNTNFTIVEGLIVDPNNGGVGFRNHTIPVGLQLGATWQEDILWIQPETVCTANNFSIHFPFGNSHVNELFPVLNTGTVEFCNEQLFAGRWCFCPQELEHPFSSLGQLWSRFSLEYHRANPRSRPEIFSGGLVGQFLHRCCVRYIRKFYYGCWNTVWPTFYKLHNCRKPFCYYNQQYRWGDL